MYPYLYRQGYGLISQGFAYFTADKQAAVLTAARDKVNADMEKVDENNKGADFAKKIADSMNTSPEKIKLGAIASMAAAILCLLGAFLMWQLKKTGFYAYVAGTLIGVISPFVIFGTANFMAIISSVMIGFIGLIFVILYGVNLRHMR